MAAGVEYTIDELARQAGTTVRSLRVYHERGVLPPPQVKGRTGFYGPEHLNRVRTISRLLDRGIKLNGIKELLNAWGRGDDLGDILGVADAGEAESSVAVPSAEPGETIAATELVERYRDVPNGLARVVAAGLYEPVDAATYRISDRRLIRVIEKLAGAGVPIPEILDELERLRGDADRIARRFVDLFRRTAFASFQQSERGSAEQVELGDRLRTARSLPGETTAELVNLFVARYLDQDTELAEALTED
ncbi:MerR family transcriptional regulator [Nocardia australiensis]|uniref:MerR family transcriptional regulator n=1 Tax=Nocardia australiensis TaxID=2887191 RepID=UPI001D15D4CF|nr:MerR family transcriptional regulator [Nocardia australiensis]